MKARRKVVVVVVAAMALLVVAFILFWPEGGAHYQGRPVGFWFRQYYLVGLSQDADRTPEQVEEAFAKLGTNALRYLVNEALSTRPDTAFRANLYKVLARLPEFLHAPPYVRYADIREQALSAIGEIKPSATAVLPLVQKALEGTNVLQQMQAMKILVGIEEQRETMVPIFARLLHSKNRLVRHSATGWIASLGPDAKAAVPDLAQLVLETDVSVSLNHDVLAALGAMGSNAMPAVPALQAKFATETNWPARGTLATTLCQIDPQQTDALNYLIATLNRPDPNIPSSRSHEAAMLLANIGQNARAAVPALMDCLGATDTELVTMIVEALKEIGEPGASFVPKLEARLKSGGELERLEIAKCILSVDPSNQAAQSALVKLVKDRSGSSLLALYGLWVATPMAPETVAVLREARSSEDPRIRSAAARILMKIGPLDPAK